MRYEEAIEYGCAYESRGKWVALLSSPDQNIPIYRVEYDDEKEARIAVNNHLAELMAMCPGEPLKIYTRFEDVPEPNCTERNAWNAVTADQRYECLNERERDMMGCMWCCAVRWDKLCASFMDAHTREKTLDELGRKGAIVVTQPGADGPHYSPAEAWQQVAEDIGLGKHSPETM